MAFPFAVERLVSFRFGSFVGGFTFSVVGQFERPRKIDENTCCLSQALGYCDDAMKNKAAQQLGRLGGKVTTEAKAEAARANGTKGGRPAREQVYLVQYEGKLDCTFSLADKVRPARAGQSYIDGTEMTAREAKKFNERSYHAGGSTVALLYSHVRVSPGSVKVIAGPFPYVSGTPENSYKSEVTINGKAWTWNRAGDYECDGEKGGELIDVLKKEAK